MNKYILLTIKGLGNPESVRIEELKKSADDAAAAAAYAADDATAYAAAAAYAVYASAYATADAEKWVDRFFKMSGEDRKKYISEIKGKQKMTTPHEKNITIEINGIDCDARAYFEFTPEEAATHDCPGCDEELAIGKLVIEYYREDSTIKQYQDASWMLDIKDVFDTVMEAIQERDYEH
tara:strand:+ start:858 stop:1394 length:537 start_codon:yes stop_codon:yes gene_type:complete